MHQQQNCWCKSYMGKKLKLLSKEDVRMAIRRRGNEIAAQMTDEEIYRSPEFASYAGRLADFILRNHKLYSLDIQYISDPSAYIAYTDGKKIVLNTGNVMAQFPKLLERRFKTNMGILFHECAHKLFLDFRVNHSALKKIEGGKLYGKFATNGDTALETAKKELEKVTASQYAAAITKIYATVCNIIDDGHDEAAMKRCFPGFIADCIETAGSVQMETADTLAEAIDSRRSRYSIYCALILQYAKFGYYKIGEESPQTDEYIQFVSKLEPIIDEALGIDSLKDRWDMINLLVLHLWPCLREMFPDDPQSQSGGAGGSQTGQNAGGKQAPSSASGGAGACQGADSQQSVEEIVKAIEEAMKEAERATNAAPAPVNCSGSAVDPQQLQTGAITPGSSGDISDVAQAIGQKKATESVQNELDQAQMEAIRNSNLPLIHRKVEMEIVRHNPANETMYKQLLAEVLPLVRNLVREMKALLRELNEEAVDHHRRIGPIVEATESYRPDHAFFARKKLPEDLPNMALCILIDQSGSMSGNKLRCAIRTAIMLERFASELDIPVMIAGHDVGGEVNLRIFTDFVSAMSEKDRYSLAGIEAGGCNRDGLPIHVCCDLLAQRQERVRLMVVISDGAPNDRGYRGEEAREDIRKTVNAFRRKGLLIYGAAIDNDRAVIEEIYGKGFLSIQDLTNLPKTLVRLIRQQII